MCVKRFYRQKACTRGLCIESRLGHAEFSSKAALNVRECVPKAGLNVGCWYRKQGCTWGILYGWQACAWGVCIAGWNVGGLYGKAAHLIPSRARFVSADQNVNAVLLRIPRTLPVDCLYFSPLFGSAVLVQYTCNGLFLVLFHLAHVLPRAQPVGSRDRQQK